MCSGNISQTDIDKLTNIIRIYPIPALKIQGKFDSWIDFTELLNISKNLELYSLYNTTGILKQVFGDLEKIETSGISFAQNKDGYLTTKLSFFPDTLKSLIMPDVNLEFDKNIDLEELHCRINYSVLYEYIMNHGTKLIHPSILFLLINSS